jgi:hypothetical protein
MSTTSYVSNSGTFNQQSRPTSLFFGGSNKYNDGSNNNNNSLINDVFGDEQEDQIVPDCSVAPKLDLSPMNEPWSGMMNMQHPSGSATSTDSSGFLTTAVHLSLHEVSHVCPPFKVLCCATDDDVIAPS